MDIFPTVSSEGWSLNGSSLVSGLFPHNPFFIFFIVVGEFSKKKARIPALFDSSELGEIGEGVKVLREGFGGDTFYTKKGN